MDKKHNSCLICTSNNIYSLLEYKKHQLSKCKQCGFVFMSRVPTLQELNEHYSSYAYESEGYLSPITIQRYNELLDVFEKYKKTNNLLDVGCGRGYFLEQAKKRGWNICGTEYSDKAIEICEKKGIKMKQGKLNAQDFGNTEFDVITSFEVIEHINNPLEEMQHICSLLRKRGLLYVTTPNFNSLLRHRLKAEWNIIEYPEHLSYYTPKTIKFLAKKFNLETVKVQTTGISLTRLKTSMGKSTERLISKESSDESLRILIEQNWYLGAAKIVVNSILSFFGAGDALKGYFVKK